MRVEAKIINLEWVTYVERQRDEEGNELKGPDGKVLENRYEGVEVTLKLASETKQTNTIKPTLKQEHIKQGAHVRLSQLIQKPILINLGYMQPERQNQPLTWFFAKPESFGLGIIELPPNLSSFNNEGFDPYAHAASTFDVVDASTGEIKDPKAFHSKPEAVPNVSDSKDSNKDKSKSSVMSFGSTG